MVWNDELKDKLQSRGYTLDHSSINAKGKLLLVVSGEGITRCALFRPEAVRLAEGRVSLRQLLDRRDQR